MTEKNHAEKMQLARDLVMNAEDNPELDIRGQALAAAGYFLLMEVYRLQKLEVKVLERVKKASDEITELNEDWQAASDADCDFEVFERIEREMGRAQAQLKALGSLLG